MPFSLPNLSYAYNALEPHIDAKTMEIHHAKHHAAYINKLNTALEKTSFKELSIQAILKDITLIPESIRTAIRNNGGGHANHSFFWTILTAEKENQSLTNRKIVSAITDTFGSFEYFKQRFTNAAMTRFGSGWAWLVIKDNTLSITSTPNQDSPYIDDATPLVGLDVWEHAYYLNYQNRRAHYIEAFFSIINWEKVDFLYKKALTNN